MKRGAWCVGAVLAGVLGCGSRLTGGEPGNSDHVAGSGGAGGHPSSRGGGPQVTSGGLTGAGVGTGGASALGGASAGASSAGGTVAGGTSAGGTAPSGTSAGGCMEYGALCEASVTVPILSLPNGSLVVCLGPDCIEPPVMDGKIGAVMTQGLVRQGVELVGESLRARWWDVQGGFPPVCVAPTGNSLSFKSPAGTVLPLFSGTIPQSGLFDGCFRRDAGSTTVQEPVDIAARVRELEGAAGGAGGGGNGSDGGSGGAP